MDQKVILILLILLFYPKILPASVIEVEDGKLAEIRCRPPEGGTILFFFRAVDQSGMEFIASLSPMGVKKLAGPNYNKQLVIDKAGSDFVVKVKSFSKETDSGLYICASLVKGTNLTFAPATRLTRPKPPATINPPVVQVFTTTQTTTQTNCCKEKSGPSMFCDPIILGSLAGGCGLLLLLLITTILYCNKIRTRRCPHHYKRKLRVMAPEKQQMLTNRH